MSFTIYGQCAARPLHKQQGSQFRQTRTMPAEFKTAEYWRHLISNAGDAHHPTETYTVLDYENGQNKRFAFPTKALHKFDLSLPLHVYIYVDEQRNV